MLHEVVRDGIIKAINKTNDPDFLSRPHRQLICAELQNIDAISSDTVCDIILNTYNQLLDSSEQPEKKRTKPNSDDSMVDESIKQKLDKIAAQAATLFQKKTRNCCWTILDV